jgi:hypothetical protein
MKANTEYGLEGAFKVDIFNGKGNLIDTTDYFSNFITYSGLTYPLTYHFPECFKFLTIGTSNAANSTITTGIAGTPVSFSVIDVFNGSSFPDQSLSYLGPVNYSKGDCGVQVSKDGPAYLRGWRIPTGTNTAAGEDVTFREFMVSPSSGSDASGRVAFSRVAREVTLRSGASAIVSYRLKLKVQSTGINYLTGFDTTKADLEDGELVTLWNTGTTGHYRQVYHGLSVMDPNGNTFIPKFGDAMEPACRNFNNLAAYFSADNSQFDCNPTGGNALSFSKSYNADGLLNVAFGHEYDTFVGLGEPKDYTFIKTAFQDQPDEQGLKNYAKDIRYKTVKDPDYTEYTGLSISASYDATFSTTNVSVASPGKLGYDAELLDYRNKTTIASVVIPLRFNPNSGQQDRKKTITRRAIFTPVKSYGYNSRFGSFVYAFKNGSDYWPVVDCLFSNNSGQLLMDHFRAITGVNFNSNGAGVSAVSGRMVLSPESFGKFNYELLVDSSGLLTGFVKNEAYNSGLYDLSLAAHKLTDLNEPSTTGKLYYPTSATEDNLVSIKFNDLHFYRGGLGTISSGAYNFTPTTQLIADFKFSGLKSSGTSGTILTTYLTGSNVLAVADSLVSGGFYITSGQFAGTGSEGNLNELALSGSLINYTLSYFSGSLYSGNTFFTGFSVVVTPESGFIVDVSGQDYLITAKRVTRFFDTGDFMSSLLNRGSGISLPNSEFNVRFSGKDTSNNDLYLTYLRNVDSNNPGFWEGTSSITGLVKYTDFSTPSITYMHAETGMLKPNNYYLGYTGNVLSQIHGGTYPGLSDKNTLEVDINLSWSAPCAGVAGCSEPT